ncbi:hypothetical protein GCM10027594_32930 [Hymenobacter agri]
MPATLQILRACSIAGHTVRVNGADVVTGPAGPFGDFAEAAYRQLGVDYPKFHKMDNLAKLGFLAAEYLLTNTNPLTGTVPEQRGIVVANATSSLDADLRYQTQVMQQRPSPALFVYTLPNIALGEICIRHGIKGENMLFIAPNYEAAPQVTYLSSLLAAGTLTTALGGWLDFSSRGYQAFLYVVGASADSTLPAFTSENVAQLFSS